MVTHNPISTPTGAAMKSDCLQCVAGFACTTQGLTTPNELCEAGYYCPEGQKIRTGTPCPVGYYCPTGTAGTGDDKHSGKRCNTGFEAPIQGLAECQRCPQGYHCYINEDTNESEKEDCPAGHYCPLEETEPVKCPAGTFSNILGLAAESHCSPCPPNFYCANAGATTDADKQPCSAGYECLGRATTSTPTDGTTGRLCPAGYYCPGNSNRESCPKGTFRNLEGAESEVDCQKCLGGFYNDISGQTNCTKQCQSGYYCTEGATQSNPDDGTTGNICDKGFYCPAGSKSQLSCEPGTYNPSTGAGACLACTAGRICPDSEMKEVGDACPAGRYCQAGSVNGEDCPVGRFRATTGAQQQFG
eukprot:sb/3466053/